MSLGIASYPQDGKNLEQLIKRADTALYAAKQMGRNKVVAYESDLEQPLADKRHSAASDSIGNP
jgi:predicted signal transduction protein with EAL and GGDEF domain